MIDKNKLYDWQRDAYEEWSRGRKGIVVSPTGVGKTTFALYCMQTVRKSTIIIVPTIVLMKQWKEEILKNLDISEDKIGLYYGEKKEIKPITIAVINSIREEDLSKFHMCCLDEIHRYGSIENIKPLKRSNFKCKLGITATLKREDNKHLDLIECIGDIVYEYGQKDAIDDGILNKFSLINVGVNMPFEEKKKYDELDAFIKEKMPQFNYDFIAITKMVRQWGNPLSRVAQELLKKISSRRMLYSNSEAKLDKVCELVEKHLSDKIIIFNEYIGMAEDIYKKLEDKMYRVGMYHSGAKDLSVIKRFDDGKINILVAVKSLNEGLNVKSANVGIMVSSNTVKRNTIQRLGRIIRKQEGKKAYFYQMFCRFTKESADVRKKTNMLNQFANNIDWQ